MQPQSKKEKQKLKKKKNTINEDEEKSRGGKFVRIKPEIVPKESKNDVNKLKRTISEESETSASKKKRKLEKSLKNSESFPPKSKNKNVSNDHLKDNKFIQNKKPIIKGPSSNTFTQQLRENLKGSRFRFINEQLYQTEGKAAFALFKKDPEAFQAYHEGYRGQVEHWPMNPLQRMINSIKRM